MSSPDASSASSSAKLNPDLEKIKAPAAVSDRPDVLTQAELEIAERRLHNVDLEQIIKQRKTYALWVFVLVVCWLIGIYAILILQGFHARGFELTEKVLIASIASTTANIIGILVIIVKYLFAQTHTPRVTRPTSSKK